MWSNVAVILKEKRTWSKKKRGRGGWKNIFWKFHHHVGMVRWRIARGSVQNTRDRTRRPSLRFHPRWPDQRKKEKEREISALNFIEVVSAQLALCNTKSKRNEEFCSRVSYEKLMKFLPSYLSTYTYSTIDLQDKFEISIEKFHYRFNAIWTPPENYFFNDFRIPIPVASRYSSSSTAIKRFILNHDIEKRKTTSLEIIRFLFR